MVSDKGRCISKEEKFFSNCKTSGLESIEECQTACISLEVCLGINYDKASQLCNLITTSKPTNGCPKGFTWRDMVAGFAKSVDDLYTSGSNPNYLCYAKIQVDKKELR